MKKAITVKKAYVTVMLAAQAFADAKGEAQWTNGYRACYERDRRRINDSESARLFDKEQRQHELVDTRADQFKVAISAYRRVILSQAKRKSEKAP